MIALTGTAVTRVKASAAPLSLANSRQETNVRGEPVVRPLEDCAPVRTTDLGGRTVNACRAADVGFVQGALGRVEPVIERDRHEVLSGRQVAQAADLDVVVRLDDVVVLREVDVARTCGCRGTRSPVALRR